jgi:molybdopterin-biosynthesis enzyme MoeA-like protein
MNFYAVIIGTEILNNRRKDKHFEFIRDELAKYGHELFSSIIIKDDEALISRTYKMILEDKKSVLFSFGGIGSTPDDLTREIASEVFTHAKTLRHEQFYNDIVERFAEKAFPHRIHMADLPPNADLIFNPINNMSGFSLENRFFFVPGFPSMAHPMISSVIQTHFSKKITKYRKTFIAQTSEETLITLMQTLPKEIELSCLPMFVNDKPQVELSLSSVDEKIVLKYFELFIADLKKRGIRYK